MPLAVVIERPGDYSRLELRRRPSASPGVGQVVVRTLAVGVNFADCVVRMGLYESAKKYVGWPITPGFEFAGEITALGAGVTRFRVGQRVCGLVRFGAYAEEVVADERLLYEPPEQWSDGDAAGFSVVFLTAWYALREHCKLRPGMKVLVHSGAGGVGGAALQIARACGCVPIAVVGARHKVRAAQAFGAAHVIDSSSGRLWQELEALAPSGVDVVLDPNGAATLRQSYRHLAPTGRLVIYGFQSMLSRGRGRPNWFKLAWSFARTPCFQPLRLTNDNKSVLAFNLSYLFDQQEVLREALDELLSWVRSGALSPLSTVSYALSDVAQAHRALETGATTGKLVLVPASAGAASNAERRAGEEFTRRGELP